MRAYPIFILLFANLLFTALSAQPVDVFKTPTVTFFGLDFSQAKFIGYGFNNQELIKDRVIEQWNMLLASEQSKYNIKNAFSKKEVIYDIKRIKKINDAIENQLLFPDSTIALTLIKPEEIRTHINQLETSGYKGLGLLLVVDYFSKEQENADIVVVFFDIEQKQILLQKRMSGSPGGVTFRNYWAGAINEIIENCGRAYKKWQIEKN